MLSSLLLSKETWELIPNRVFSVTGEVVRCNKKPGPPVRLAGFLSASDQVLIAAAKCSDPGEGPQPRLPTRI